MTIVALAAGVCGTGLTAHVFSAALAATRCQRRSQPMAAPLIAPAVSIVQPLCGIETFSAETLHSIFALDYPDYEIVFCVAKADDPIVALARGAIADHPHIAARLLIGDDHICGNPKLNNVVKGWKATRKGWVVIADSNVLMPPDYIQRLLASWRPNSGVVCAPPIGSRAQSLAAEIECAFLNTYQARWQYAADSVGLGFAQGKTMLWRRDILERCGGIAALGAEIAEDAASTKLMRRAGLSAHLVDAPFSQPLGSRRFRDVWARQLRWARLRRATFAPYFALEPLTTSLVVIAAAPVAAPEFGLSPWTAAVLAALVWYGAEGALALVAGWSLGWASPIAWIARDLLLPWLWLRGWSRNRFEWRGNAMSVDEAPLSEVSPR